MVVVRKLLKVKLYYLWSQPNHWKNDNSTWRKTRSWEQTLCNNMHNSLGQRSDPEKGLHSLPGLPIPSKRSLVDSEELQSYTPLAIWGNSNFPGRGPQSLGRFRAKNRANEEARIIIWLQVITNSYALQKIDSALKQKRCTDQMSMRIQMWECFKEVHYFLRP